MNARPGPVAVVFVLVVAPQGCHGAQTDGIGKEDLSAGINPHLWVFEALEVRIQVEFYALRSTWQSYATDQQDDKHDKRECGRDVDNLSSGFYALPDTKEADDPNKE